MDVKIRNSVAEDWKMVQLLNNHVFLNDASHDEDINLEWPFTEIGEKYYRDITTGNYGHCLIAEIDNKIVGYAALAEKKVDYRKSKYIEIENIGVLPDIDPKE